MYGSPINVQLNYTDMKKIMFALCLLFGVAMAVNAQDTTSTQSTQDQSQYKTNAQDQDDDKDKREISVAQLPTAVRDQLQGQNYTGWTVNKAYEREKNGEFTYAVELKNGSEVKKVKFDAQGNLLKEKDKKDHDQK
jgi:hypothetical protein